ncbi:hypothetical protein AB6V46_14100, partial [Stenotrophomonas maltophilia]
MQVHAHINPQPAGNTQPKVDNTGQNTEKPKAGAVEIERDGPTRRLEAIGAPRQPQFQIYADPTTGPGSYPAGRNH